MHNSRSKRRHWMLLFAFAFSVAAVTTVSFFLFLASFGFGLTVGSTLLMQPLLVAEAFGVRSYARVYSITSLVTAAGIALGPTLLGALVQGGQSYSTAFACMLILSASGALAMLLAEELDVP